MLTIECKPFSPLKYTCEIPLHVIKFAKEINPQIKYGLQLNQSQIAASNQYHLVDRPNTIPIEKATCQHRHHANDT